MNGQLGNRQKTAMDSPSAFLKPPSSPISPPSVRITVAPATGKKHLMGTALETTVDTVSKRGPAGVLMHPKSPKEESSLRKDRMGKPIDKGGKKHRVTFRDAITGGNVADINEVESYKKYNILSEEKVTGCGCVLL